MLTLAQAFSRYLPPPAFDEDGWITMNGTPIKVDGQGEAVAGPANVVKGEASSKPSNPEKNSGRSRGNPPVVELDSNELAVKPGESLKDAAIRYYDTLRSSPANRDGFGKVDFTRKGQSKTASAALSDQEKLKLLPAAKPLIEKGDYIGRTKLEQPRKDGVVAFHYFEGNVATGKGNKFIGVTVCEDNRGNKFYNLNENPDLLLAKKKARESAEDSARGLVPSGNSVSEVFNIRMILIDEKVNPNNLHRFTLDAATSRRVDENGFLHVAASHISKECVNPYYGREIPGWEEAGLDPEQVYQGYRAGKPLAEGAATFNGLPLLRDHHIESADNPQKEHRVGSLGTDAAFNAPYLDNSLIITDADAIAAIENGTARELSAAYKYDPDFTPGEFRGEKYDFVMTNIRGNHVALVEEGRAGSDVLVADSALPQNLTTKRTGIMGLIDDIKKLLAQDEGLAKGPAPEKEKEGEDEATAAIPAEGGEETPAQDDDIGEELVTLIDSIGDKELAGKIKALMEKMRGGVTDEDPDAAEEDPAEDEDPDNKSACDEDAAGAEEKKEGAMDKKLKKRPAPAMDAAAVKKATVNHVRSLHSAARNVRPLVDISDPFAFDSAEAIYGKALKAHGVNYTSYPRSAWAGMCDMLKNQKAEQARPAFDAAPKIDPKSPFAGLNKIRVEG